MSKKVLIIDDNLASLNLIKIAFASDNWEAYGTQHAKKAFEMLYDIAPDILITDAIMPVMGGFQLLKTLRKNPKTAKIPVIVYSVLDYKNSKFYIKEERGEYYLKKGNSVNEIIELANKVIKKHPLSKEYKFELLKSNISLVNLIDNFEEKREKPKKEPIESEKLKAQFKEHYDFSKSDDKIFSAIFSILYPLLEYNLAIFCVDTFEKNEKTVYFDIRNIILSPILQNEILNDFETKNSFLFKKYAPNLKVITNENEFSTKINFEFEHEQNTTAKVVFFAKEKFEQLQNSDLDIIKDALDDFFRARYVNKSSKNNKKSNITSKYLIDKLDYKFNFQNDKNLYCAVVEIVNFKELQDSFSSEYVDIINSRISEKLINFVSDDEQVYKNDEDEYNMVFYAKDRNHAKQKLEWIIDIINELNNEDFKIEVQIGACNCKIDNQLNFFEAQKFAHEALGNSNNESRIVIYGTE